jgi:hypothetical protein
LPFIYENIEQPAELKVEARPNGRFYITPEGNAYPSVTTIISKASDLSWIDAWHKRVGKEEAEKVLAQAGRRGTAVHEICEEYLKNNPNYKKGHMPGNIASFNYIKPYLDEHITSVGGLELPLYSNKLKTAGRVDCLCKWDGKWAIVDFKTSRREKKREDIGGYFMQASCYALMIYELLGIFPGKIVIVMTIDDSPAKVFEERSADWIEKFIELRNGVDL